MVNTIQYLFNKTAAHNYQTHHKQITF